MSFIYERKEGGGNVIFRPVPNSIISWTQENIKSDNWKQIRVSVPTWLWHDNFENLKVVLSPTLPERLWDVPKKYLAVQEYAGRGKDDPVC